MVHFPDTMLGVLSWRAPRTLAATLENHAASGLPALFERAAVLLQEGTDEEASIVAAHGYEPVRERDNLGIFGGVERLATELEAEYLLMVENDHLVVEPPEAVPEIIARARAELRDGAVVVRLRSRRRTGSFVGIRRYLRAFGVHRALAGADHDLVPGSILQRAFRQTLWRWRERRRLGIAVHVEEDPVALHPRVILRSPHGNFLTSSAHLPWTNQCYLIRRDVLLNTLLARAAPDARRQPVARRTIEKNLPGGWWRRSGFTVAVSDPGTFAHVRLDR